MTATLKTYRNAFDELCTVIGTVSDGRGGRTEVVIEQFRTSWGKPLFALKAGPGGHPDSAKFETQVKRAKRVFADPSNAAEWYC